MIPKDIQERAKTDPLVAEILAMKQPLMYADFKRIREGNAAEIIMKRTRVTKWGLPIMSVVFGLQTAQVLWDSAFMASESGVIGILYAGALVGVMVGSVAWTYFENQKLTHLRDRILNGEFSKEAAIEA